MRRIVEAWRDLEGDRGVLVTPGGSVIYRPLPYTAQSQWLNDHGLSGPTRDRYLEIWRAIEAEYLTEANKRE